MIAFTIPGEPQGKGRARAQPIYRDGKPIMKDGRVIVAHHTPAKTVAYEGLIAHTARIAMERQPPLEMACRVDIVIACSVPASWSNRKRQQALQGLIRPAKKPDVDNIFKALFDGMNGVVWRDDVQAVGGSWDKRYSLTPGLAVRVTPVEGLLAEPMSVQQLDMLPKPLTPGQRALDEFCSEA